VSEADGDRTEHDGIVLGVLAGISVGLAYSVFRV
jgi:hypothetical protein